MVRILGGLFQFVIVWQISNQREWLDRLNLLLNTTEKTLGEEQGVSILTFRVDEVAENAACVIGITVGLLHFVLVWPVNNQNNAPIDKSHC